MRSLPTTLILFTFVLFLPITLALDEPHTIDGCGEINESGTYILTTDLLEINTTCLVIAEDNIEVHGEEEHHATPRSNKPQTKTPIRAYQTKRAAERSVYEGSKAHCSGNNQ